MSHPLTVLFMNVTQTFFSFPLKEEEHSYFKKVECNRMNKIELPQGFEVINGSLEDNSIAYDACHWGFHPETEDEKSNVIPHDWKTREQAPMFDYKYQII